MSLSEWVSCPEYDCSKDENVTVDISYSQDMALISFWCPACEYGSLEDDFRWWVCCPQCDCGASEKPVDHITGNVTRSGEIEFECEKCGASLRSYPTTRWDSR